MELAEIFDRGCYGTFRSAALGNYLQNHDTVHLNCIVLISSVLDLATLTFAPGDDRPYIFYLPSYAAVAWYLQGAEGIGQRTAGIYR